MINITRHQSIFKPSQCRDRITIIGAGATGSRVFMSLVELGFTKITVIDFDVVESHNLANQAFLHKHIGELKVDALYDLFKLKVGNTPPDSMKFIEGRVDKDTPQDQIEGVVFLLTDTMASRREIFETCLKDNLGVSYVVETRMASSYGNVNTFDPNVPSQADAWEGSLISDEGGEVSPCGQSISVGATASLIANLAVWQFILLHKDRSAHDPNVEIHFHPLMLIGE